MSITAPPAERFAIILHWLGRIVAARSAGGRLPGLLIVLIAQRLADIERRVARLAARLHAGRSAPRLAAAPRLTAAPRARAPRRPRRASPLPRGRGWLLRLAPETAGHRAQLEHLLQDPAMTALLAAAPPAMARPVRSLCWMLRLPPPPTLSRPAAPRPPDPARPPPPAPKPVSPSLLRHPGAPRLPGVPRAPVVLRRPGVPRPQGNLRACGPPPPA